SLITPLLWDFSIGVLAGVFVAVLLGFLAGLVTGASFAQTDHEQRVQELKSGIRIENEKGMPELGSSPITFKTTSNLTKPLLIASLLTLLTVPIPIHDAKTGIDPSWSSVLNYADRQAWQFGTGIVYTYGPLGFIASPYYSSHALLLRVATKLILSFVV